MANIVIFGNADIARLAHYYFTRDSEHQISAFTVDREYIQDDSFLGLPLVDFEQVGELYPPSEYKMFVAISYARMNRVRAEKFLQVKRLGYECVSYVSSKCSFLTEFPIGENCFIQEDNSVQPFSCFF